MQKDLEQLFNITVTKEKRMVKVYVLRKTKGYEKLISKGGESKYDGTAFFLNYENAPFSSLIKKIKYCIANREVGTVIDETNIDSNIDIDINVRTFDFKEMRKALKKYGLEFTIEKIEREVYVIKDI